MCLYLILKIILIIVLGVQIYHDYMQVGVKTNHEFFPNGFLIHKKRIIFPSFSFFKLEEVSYAYSQSKEFIIRSSQ